MHIGGDDFGADEVAFLAVADHLRAADAAEGAQRGEQVDGFEDVGFALRVVAEEDVEARRKVRVQAGVIAELPQSQMGQMHSGKLRRGRKGRRAVPGGTAGSGKGGRKMGAEK